MPKDRSHISPGTESLAAKLVKTAGALKVDVGEENFSNPHDYINFWLTNGLQYLAIYATPDLYLVEHFSICGNDIVEAYGIVKNLRHLLLYARRTKMTSVVAYFEKLSEKHDIDEDEIKKIKDDLEN